MPAPVFIVRNLETLRIIADPLRMQILELLTQGSLTVKALGQKLGLDSSRLYYHVNLLETQGLIQVAAQEVVSGIIQKHYQATATRLELDPDLLSLTTEPAKTLDSLVIAALDATRSDILRSVERMTHDGARPNLSIARAVSYLSPDEIESFSQRLAALMEEFKEANSPKVGDAFALTLAFYRTRYFDQEE